MVYENDILPFGRFKYPQPYTGSCKGMRYRIVHPKPAEGEANLFYVDVWMGPYSYEKVDEEALIKRTFEYSKEGYDAILPYLNEIYLNDREKWESKEAMSII